jgi:hypothetical protein
VLGHALRRDEIVVGKPVLWECRAGREHTESKRRESKRRK